MLEVVERLDRARDRLVRGLAVEPGEAGDAARRRARTQGRRGPSAPSATDARSAAPSYHRSKARRRGCDRRSDCTGAPRRFSVAIYERSAAYRSGCGRAAGCGAPAGDRRRARPRRSPPHHAAGGVTHAGPPIEPAAHVPPDARRARLGAVARGRRRHAGRGARSSSRTARSRSPTNHDTGGVGPMAGVVNPSMPVWVARDEATGKIAWCPLNEGSGAVLRYGADGPEVLERLKWMRDVLAPELRAALSARGPLDLYDLHVRSLALGDEAHHRTEAGHGADAGGARHRAPRGARLHRGQRPVLPQPGDGLLQARAGLRRGRAGLAGPHRDRPQRRRGRHPRLRASATAGSSARPRCPTRRSCSTATRRPT